MNPMANMMMAPLQQKMQQCMSTALDRMMGTGQMPAPRTVRKSFHEEMAAYFEDISRGKAEIPDAMAEAMALAAMQAVAAYVTKHEAMKDALTECAVADVEQAEAATHHRKYKEVIDKMREAAATSEVNRIIDEHFDNLTPEERSCLLQMAKAHSLKGNAACIRVSVDQWHELKKSAEGKLKV